MTKKRGRPKGTRKGCKLESVFRIHNGRKQEVRGYIRKSCLTKK